ncbi:PREDICTED: uncharacterized protein LOC109174486 [Ipomoea nil]|uniref:uncharacterized protein LOC109174486 n=1 Tax=Ipomoea nil TaxID=35883 RepID=UPI000900DF6A|nr:PREDICTED: uncharacterized protein LOC109174486 [Ipomoea nil]
MGNCPSYCWRSIMAAHGLVCGGVRRRISDGKATLICGHPWLPDEPSPLIQTAMPDELSGALDPRGCYTVKSGYRHIIGNEDVLGFFDKWISIWKLHVPHKWKHFRWRALNDILLTTLNLVIKIVDVDLKCPKCGLVHENVMDALILCDYSQLVCVIGGSEIKLSGSNITVTECRRRAAVSLLNWKHANGRTQQSSPTDVLPQSSGRPKCFFDAGFRPASGSASYAAVLLAHDGSFLAACSGLLADCFSPLMAEALACKEVLSWLKDRVY